MKKIIFIIVLSMQGISFAASVNHPVPAGQKTVKSVQCGFNPARQYTEEITAQWERDSDAKMMGESVISGFMNRDKNSLQFNSFCSPESISRLRALRELAVKIISSPLNGHHGSSEKYIAGEILSGMEKISITPLTPREKELLTAAEEQSLSHDYHAGRAFGSAEIPLPEYAASLPGVTLPAPQTQKLKIQKEHAAGKISCSMNPVRVKNINEREFTDLYRLFLYVREVTGNGKARNIKYCSPFASPRRLIQISITDKNTFKTEPRFTKPGAFS